MSNEAANKIRSPSYPTMSLADAVEAVRKIEGQYRSSDVDRTVAAKLLGYSGITGASASVMAALAHFGLVERAGKGHLRVTARARAILHPQSPAEKRENLFAAALAPDLFRELQERFPDMIPPEDGVVTHLNRQGFNPSAVRPAAKAYLSTLTYLEEAGVSESHGKQAEPDADPSKPKVGDNAKFGGARVGDFIQWEAGGVLQFETPKRVRLISLDGQHVAVDGIEAGIPMEQVIVEQRASEGKPQPPMFPLGLGEIPEREPLVLAGEAEWMRNKVGVGTTVRLMVSGDMGPKEIGKLIRLLEAQKAVLTDDDD